MKCFEARNVSWWLNVWQLIASVMSPVVSEQTIKCLCFHPNTAHHMASMTAKQTIRSQQTVSLRFKPHGESVFVYFEDLQRPEIEMLGRQHHLLTSGGAVIATDVSYTLSCCRESTKEPNLPLKIVPNKYNFHSTTLLHFTFTTTVSGNQSF